MNKKAIGSRIRKIRENLRLGQRDFGKKIGVSNASVSAYEVGNSYPAFETLARIAKLGKVSVAWLIVGDALPGSLDAILPADDVLLLKAFHKASDEDRKILLRLAELMAGGGITPAG